MPHLDVVSYFTQYMWAVFALLSLFFIVGIGILPIFYRGYRNFAYFTAPISGAS